MAEKNTKKVRHRRTNSRTIERIAIGVFELVSLTVFQSSLFGCLLRLILINAGETIFPNQSTAHKIQHL